MKIDKYLAAGKDVKLVEECLEVNKQLATNFQAFLYYMNLKRQQDAIAQRKK